MERLKEAQNINRSLLALGNVISALCEKRNHIPYRDSKLTRLLQNCFGGNAFTTVILNCSSNSYNALETLSTLRFGDRANKVHNRPQINQTESIDEMRRMLGEATFKLATASRIIRDLSNKNEDLETMVWELSSALNIAQQR